jgi:hypothetical protein
MHLPLFMRVNTDVPASNTETCRQGWSREITETTDNKEQYITALVVRDRYWLQWPGGWFLSVANVPICQRHTSEQGDCTKLSGFSPASYHDGPEPIPREYTSDVVDRLARRRGFLWVLRFYPVNYHIISAVTFAHKMVKRSYWLKTSEMIKKLTSWSEVFLINNYFFSQSRYFSQFTQPASSLPCFQDPATCPYSKSD